MDTPRIYVGTYAKYNQGSIEGEWVDLDDFNTCKVFMEYCEELHGDEDDPEFMFQDHEGIPEIFIGESWLRRDFWDFMELTKDWDDDKHEAFQIWCEDKGYDFGSSGAEGIIDEFEEAYEGYWGNSLKDPKEEFAEELFDEIFMPDVPENIKGYIDYKAFARDLFIVDYWEEKGHVFRRI